MAWAPIRTSASRCSRSAASASSSAARAATRMSASPGGLIGCHPVEQYRRFAGVATRAGEQIDGYLADGRNPYAVDHLRALEDDVVVAVSQGDVGAALGRSQLEQLGGGGDVRHVEHCQTRGRVGCDTLGGERA